MQDDGPKDPADPADPNNPGVPAVAPAPKPASEADPEKPAAEKKSAEDKGYKEKTKDEERLEKQKAYEQRRWGLELSGKHPREQFDIVKKKLEEGRQEQIAKTGKALEGTKGNNLGEELAALLLQFLSNVEEASSRKYQYAKYNLKARRGDKNKDEEETDNKLAENKDKKKEEEADNDEKLFTEGSVGPETTEETEHLVSVGPKTFEDAMKEMEEIKPVVDVLRVTNKLEQGQEGIKETAGGEVAGLEQPELGGQPDPAGQQPEAVVPGLEAFKAAAAADAAEPAPQSPKQGQGPGAIPQLTPQSSAGKAKKEEDAPAPAPAQEQGPKRRSPSSRSTP